MNSGVEVVQIGISYRLSAAKQSCNSGRIFSKSFCLSYSHLLGEVAVKLNLHVFDIHQYHDSAACNTGVVVLVNCNSRSRIKTGVLGRSDCDDCVIGKLSELVEDGCHGFDSIQGPPCRLYGQA